MLAFAMIFGLTAQSGLTLAADSEYEYGTQKTVLLPGTYNIPVSMMNASKPDKNSMAASCIKGGSLEVKENGDAFLNVKLGAVSVMGITGWAEDWKVFQADNTAESTEIVPADVTAKDDAQNVTEIRFQIPASQIQKDGVYVQMTVSVMNMVSEAFLKLDYANAQLTKLNQPVITPESKNFDKGDKVSVAIETLNGDVYYTIDGTTPSSENGMKYEKPFDVTDTTTVKAAAVSGNVVSNVTEATYTMVKPKPVVKEGKAEVFFGSKKGYDVTAKVSVLDEKIENVEFGHNAESSSQPYAEKAKGIADSFKNIDINDAEAIQGIDTVSGATITSNAYKDAVLGALGLEKPAPEPEKPVDYTFGSAKTELKPGKYNVPILLCQDTNHDKASVAASVFGNTAVLEVAENGTATITLDLGSMAKYMT